MDLTLILGLIEAAAKLEPVIAGIVPAATALVNGTATPVDIAALEVARDTLNQMAQDAEQRVIDGGAPQPGE